MNRKRIVPISGNKQKILMMGEPGETHTIDFTLDDTLKNLAINSTGLKEVLKIVKPNEMLVLSKGQNRQLQVCRFVDMQRMK